MLGQTAPRFQLDELFTRRKIVLLRLNKGVLGAETARLLGSLLMGQLWPQILAQATEPATRRALTAVYIDEVHDFISGIPGDLADALAQSRSLGVAFTMAHQYRSQLSRSMRHAIDANARNKICFELSGLDASDLAKLAPGLSPADFMQLPRFGMYATTWCGGVKTGWLSGTTLRPPPVCSDPLVLEDTSSTRYGLLAEQVEAALRSNLGWGHPAAQPTSPPVTQPKFGRIAKPPDY